MNALAQTYSKRGWRVDVGTAGTKLMRGRDVIHISYIGKPESSGLGVVYGDFIDKAEEVRVMRSSQVAHPHVIVPAHLIAAKLTAAANKEKHTGDVTNLLRVFKNTGFPFEDEDVRSVLKSIGRPEEIEALDRILASL